MSKEAVFSAAGPLGGAPYSPAVKIGNTIYASGQIPLDPATGKIVEGGISEQTTQALENLKSLLAQAGFELTDIVKTSVFLADLNDFAEMNKIYATYFSGIRPARSTLQVARIPADSLVEIEAIAIKIGE
jgi:2-iminobutanoate/2-iminopropanoate deaminase